MVESTLNDLNITSHQTSGFYLLHKKVQLKEMDQGTINVDGISPGSWMQQKSQHVCNIAQKALNQLKNMPPTSYKWTWHETLTWDEVLDFRSRPSHQVHSGYQVSLRDGLIQRIPSSTNTAPTGTADYSILYPNSHNPLPQTSQCLPNFFGWYKSSSPSLPSIQSLHISVSTSHHPGSAHINDSGHLPNSGQCADLGGIVDFAAAVHTWMEMVDNASILSTTPAPSASPPSNLATTTALWMEMQGSDTPIIKPTPNVGHSADSWPCQLRGHCQFLSCSMHLNGDDWYCLLRFHHIFTFFISASLVILLFHDLCLDCVLPCCLLVFFIYFILRLCTSPSHHVQPWWLNAFLTHPYV